MSVIPRRLSPLLRKILFISHNHSKRHQYNSALVLFAFNILIEQLHIFLYSTIEQGFRTGSQFVETLENGFEIFLVLKIVFLYIDLGLYTKSTIIPFNKFFFMYYNKILLMIFNVDQFRPTHFLIQ